MMAAVDPYLSVVLASRNDSYAGGMLQRLQVFVDAFLDQTERFALPSELILVDWNPPEGKALWNALTWPASSTWCTVRGITVPPTLHVTVPFHTVLPILIHRARNVGVRRARGAFILPTSADILFSDDLIQEFGKRQLDAGVVYRIARHDVPAAALEIAGHRERLRYCETHVVQVHQRDKSYNRPGLPQLFTNAAGDFTLMSRASYAALRGIPEEREYHSAHFDGALCFMAYAAGMPEIVFTDPCRIYHVDHGEPSWKLRRSWLERMVRKLPVSEKRSNRLAKWARTWAPPRSPLERLGVPYVKSGGGAKYDALIRSIVEAGGTFQYNDPNWGFGDQAPPERVIAASRLSEASDTSGGTALAS